MDVAKRQKIEKRIVSRLVSDAIKAGYTISVDNLNEVVIKQSKNKKAIMAEIMSVDEEHLVLHKDGRQGRGLLTYGNDGYDVICDYNTSLETVIKGANDLADKIADKIQMKS